MDHVSWRVIGTKCCLMPLFAALEASPVLRRKKWLGAIAGKVFSPTVAALLLARGVAASTSSRSCSRGCRGRFRWEPGFGLGLGLRHGPGTSSALAKAEAGASNGENLELRAQRQSLELFALLVAETGQNLYRVVGRGLGLSRLFVVVVLPAD